MSKAFLVVYIISLLGAGNGIKERIQISTFNHLADCNAQLKLMRTSTIGKDVSSTVTAYCTQSEIKSKEIF
jgi:hypothetical protein